MVWGEEVFSEEQEIVAKTHFDNRPGRYLCHKLRPGPVIRKLYFHNSTATILAVGSVGEINGANMTFLCMNAT
jgi:hypothetical protein